MVREWRMRLNKLLEYACSIWPSMFEVNLPVCAKGDYEEGLSSVEPTPNQLSRREHACSNKALAFFFVLAVKVKGINNPKSISFLSVSGLFSILFTTSNISQQRLIANSLWVSCFILPKLSDMRRQWCPPSTTPCTTVFIVCSQTCENYHTLWLLCLNILTAAKNC